MLADLTYFYSFNSDDCHGTLGIHLLDLVQCAFAQNKKTFVLSMCYISQRYPLAPADRLKCEV